MKTFLSFLFVTLSLGLSAQVTIDNDSTCNAAFLNANLSGVLSYKIDDVILPTGVNKFTSNLSVGTTSANGKFLQTDKYAIVDQSYEAKEIKYALSGVDANSNAYTDTVSVFIKPDFAVVGSAGTFALGGTAINFDFTYGGFALAPTGTEYYWVPSYLVDGGAPSTAIGEATRKAVAPSIPLILDTLSGSGYEKYYIWTVLNGCVFTPSNSIDTAGVADLYVFVMPNPQRLSSLENEVLEKGIVLDSMGRTIYKGNYREARSRLPAGTYIYVDETGKVKRFSKQ